MAYNKGHFDLAAPSGQSRFHDELGLKNLGVTVHVLARGEGFDFFHNHREQEEVYFCLAGCATLRIGGEQPELLHLQPGDAVRVDAATLRAIGNDSCERAVVLITGACPHPYPAGIGHHDVIADVLTMTGVGETGFTLPPYIQTSSASFDDDDC